MKEVVIIGCGAVAAEVCSYIVDINKLMSEKISIKGFLSNDIEDYNKSKLKYAFKSPYLGSVDSYDFSKHEFYMIGFANIQGRAKLLSKISYRKLNFLNIIHPTSQIAETARIGMGNVIYPNCVIGPNATLGDYNLITSYSFISHDCIVGNNNFLSTTGLSGNVSIGDNNFFGIRGTVIPGISIGNDNTVQAGMTIDKDITNDETVFYRYKEKISIIHRA